MKFRIFFKTLIRVCKQSLEIHEIDHPCISNDGRNSNRLLLSLHSIIALSVYPSLYILVCGYYLYDSDDSSTFLMKLSEIFPALHTLKITVDERIFGFAWRWKISVLESVLNALGSIKNLIISKMGCGLQIPDGFDKPMVQIAMLEALDIIEKKFPFDSTEFELEIDGVMTQSDSDDRNRLTIIKEKGKGPFLKIRRKIFFEDQVN